MLIKGDHQWNATISYNEETSEPILAIEGIAFEDLNLAPVRTILYRHFFRKNF